MPNTGIITEVPLGLVELDDAGTVLYYNREGGPAAAAPTHEMVGRNFYTDVAPVADAQEFRNTLAAFRRAHAPSHSFNFTFRAGDDALPTRILLARIHEKSEAGGRGSLLVQIKKAS
ncbi:MAG TPA: PAS domain-containing protein [Pyrinomonadaceae bacterium]|nr:PAS domain-containing protein [Pyrinomonadaceae bacterium]